MFGSVGALIVMKLPGSDRSGTRTKQYCGAASACVFFSSFASFCSPE